MLLFLFRKPNKRNKYSAQGEKKCLLDTDAHIQYFLFLLHLFIQYFHKSAIYLKSEMVVDKFFGLGSQDCGGPVFRSHPTALPKTEPLPPFGGDVTVASSNSDLLLPVGVGGGVRGMWCDTLCVFKSWLDVGEASGHIVEPFRSSLSWFHKLRPKGRLVDLRRGDSLEKQHLCFF